MEKRTYSERFILGFEDANGVLTLRGKRAKALSANFPPEFACMLLEAERLNIVEQILSVIAIYTASSDISKVGSINWLHHLSIVDTISDVHAQLKLFSRADQLSADIISNHSYNAARRYRDIAHKESLSAIDLMSSQPDTDQNIADKVRLAIGAGMMMHLYRQTHDGIVAMHSGETVDRRISHHTIRNVKPGDYFFAWPWEYKGEDLLRLILPVSLQQIAEIAPHCFHIHEGTNTFYDTKSGKVLTDVHVCFLNTSVGVDSREATETPVTLQMKAHGVAREKAAQARQTLLQFKVQRRGWVERGLMNLSLEIQAQIDQGIPSISLDAIERYSQICTELLERATREYEASKQAMAPVPNDATRLLLQILKNEDVVRSFPL